MQSERPPFLPPALGLLMMLGVFAAHFIRPIVHFFPYPANYLGLLPIAVGVVLSMLAEREFRKKGLIDPLGQAVDTVDTLVTTGIYGFTRNPAYLGLVLILSGLAIWVGSLTPWLFVVLYAFLLRKKYIEPEEAQLQERFGERYRQYCQLVPRWFLKRSRL